MHQKLKQCFFSFKSSQAYGYLCISILVCLLSACSGTPIDNLEPEIQWLSESPSSTDPEVEKFLQLAKNAFAKQRLTTPYNDNAYLWYSLLLAIDPHNVDAQHGISDIVEQYLTWALETFETGTLELSLGYIAKAKSVDETHPSISSLEANIVNRSSIRETSFVINQKQLSLREDSVKIRLQEIAEEIDRRKADIVIQAQNDSEGRWIYKQLNSYSIDRIRATFELSASPQVILHY